MRRAKTVPKAPTKALIANTQKAIPAMTSVTPPPPEPLLLPPHPRGEGLTRTDLPPRPLPKREGRDEDPGAVPVPPSRLRQSRGAGGLGSRRRQGGLEQRRRHPALGRHIESAV